VGGGALVDERPSLHQLGGGAVGAEVLPHLLPAALAVLLDGLYQGLQNDECVQMSA
jgi:hypothetical protein